VQLETGDNEKEERMIEPILTLRTHYAWRALLRAVKLMQGTIDGYATGANEECVWTEAKETIEELGAELLTTGDLCVTTLEDGDVLLLGVGKVPAAGARELEASMGARLGARLGLVLSVVVVPGAEGVFQVLRS
jgi:hypothetical protein